MKLTPTGAGAPSFAAVQAEVRGMILDNGALTASNVIAAVGTKATGGNTLYNDIIEILDEPDSIGRVPPMAGKLLMVPAISGSGFLQFLDPVTGVMTTSTLAIPNYAAGSVMFKCAVRLPSGKILLVPHANVGLVEYDPWAHTVRSILTHGRTSTGTVPAFSGAAVARDGLVYFSPGHAADKAMCTYNEGTETFTVTALVLPYNADWQATENGGTVIPLPGGGVLVLARRNVAMGAPWKVDPAAGAVTNATGSVAIIQVGGQVTPDGKYVVLAEYLNNKFRMYRISDSTVFDAYLYGTNLSANQFSAIVPLPDGKFAMIGNGYRSMVIVDPAAMTAVIAQGDFSTLATPVDASAGNTVTAKTLANGKVFVLAGINMANYFTWQPYTTGSVPEGVRTNRYVDRR